MTFISRSSHRADAPRPLVQADLAPVLVAATPGDNAVNVALGLNITLTFSEAVKPGSGAIVLHRVSDGSVAASWSVTDAGVVNIEGNVLTIDPPAAFAANGQYYITMAGGVVLDMAGNSFAGLSSPTALNFTVASAPVADLTAQLVSVDNTATSPGSFMFVQYEVVNSGDLTSSDTRAGLYLSTDQVLDPATDRQLYLTPGGFVGQIAPNSYFFVGTSFFLPADLAPGVYYLGAYADAVKAWAELDETNNASNLIRIVVSNIVNGDDKGNSLSGTASVDTLNGLAGDDTLSALAGNDILDGGTGGDLMKGGAGNDSYYVDDAADKVVELNNEGTDTVYAAVTYAAGGQYVENIVLTGTANINAGGNGLANSLTGNDGNNALNGGAGGDTMAGGLGNDLYYIDNAGDVVVEELDAGKDSVLSAISYALTANVESLGLTGFQAINGTGNALDNTITGNAAVNRLDGGDGKDLLKGMAGNDILTGGAGADLFIFSATGTANGVDHITDFVSGTDRLAFLGADYGFAKGHVLTAAELHGGASSGAFAQFLYNSINHTLYFDADGTGTIAPVAVVVFDNGATPKAADIAFT